MKTTIQDQELEDELQELYLLSDHWISDIHFIEDEARFFKNVVEKYLVPTLKNEQLYAVKYFNKDLVQLEEDMRNLKTKILGFLRFIEPMLTESKKEIGLDLLERFTFLETQMKALFESVKRVKKSLFSFTEASMKTEKMVLFSKQI
jgi:hypothetical protein